MNEYPLLFTIRDIVDGGNFVAAVVCNGSALMTDEGDEGWHCSGVEPGGVSELGDSPHEAYFFFRQAFTDSLKVFARDSSSFADFETRLLAFFARKDAEDEARWLRSRDEIRSGASVDGPFRELPKETAEEPRGLTVVRLDFQKPGEQPAVAHQIARVTEQVGIPGRKVA